MKITMLKGLPCSGKTTWAKGQQETTADLRISTKDIEKMFGKITPRNKREINKMRNRIIEAGIKLRRNVIVDDMNLDPADEKAIRQIAVNLGVRFVKNDSFLEVPPEECIKRDLKRGEKMIGAEEIWRLYYKYIVPDFRDKLRKDFAKPRCMIISLDAISRNRKKNSLDPFITCILDAVHEYGTEQGGEPYPSIFILGNEKESLRSEIEGWLEKNFIPYDKLYLRNEHDNSYIDSFERHTYLENIADYYAVLGVIEQDPTCERMWRDLGFRVFALGYMPNMICDKI